MDGQTDEQTKAFSIIPHPLRGGGLKITKGDNSINTDDRVTVLAFCTSPHTLYHCFKFHLFIFNTFRDMLRTSLLLQKLGREKLCNYLWQGYGSCNSSDGRLSMYQVSFNSLLYFQRYAPDKLFIAKIKKGSYSVNTDDRVMVLAFCNSPHGPLSEYQVSLNYLQYFAPDKSLTDGHKDGRTDGQSGDYMLSLRGAPDKSVMNGQTDGQSRDYT